MRLGLPGLTIEGWLDDVFELKVSFPRCLRSWDSAQVVVLLASRTVARCERFISPIYRLVVDVLPCVDATVDQK
jgi:hypothetical protein